jgi:hypothetical protein
LPLAFVRHLPNDAKSITWFNGLVLGAAKNRDADGAGLFGEIYDSESPQHNAAKNIINKIEKNPVFRSTLTS